MPPRVETLGRLRQEGGFTLIELLLVAVLGVVVLGGAGKLLISTAAGEPEVRERAGAIQDARVMMERVTRDVREGYGVEVAEPDRLVLLTYVNRVSCGGDTASSSIACRVEYNCSAGACLRSEGDPEAGGGLGTPVEVVRGIAGQPVFSYTPDAADPTYVEVRLRIPHPDIAGEDLITLEDGVTLRNTMLAGSGA